MEAGVPEDRWQELLNGLLWFCFLGVITKGTPVYAYDVDYSKDRIDALVRSIPGGAKLFIVHPAFRSALMMAEESS